MAAFPLMVTRGLFALADHVAPRLTGRLAFALFRRTPDPGGRSARERAALAAAAGFMAEARRHPLGGPGACAVAHEFRPQGEGPFATALVIHGWGSRTEHMRPIIEALLERGVRVIGLDLPGHGSAPGRSLDLALAVGAVAQAAQWFGPFSAVVGHSFGGAVAVNAFAGSIRGIKPVPARRLVLVASPNCMPTIFEDFGRFLNLGPRTQSAIADRVAEITGRPLGDFVSSRQLAERPVETLVIHAPDDKEVSFANARAFENAGPQVQLERAPGLGHRRILGDPAIAERIAHFVSPNAAARAERLTDAA